MEMIERKEEEVLTKLEMKGQELQIATMKFMDFCKSNETVPGKQVLEMFHAISEMRLQYDHLDRELTLIEYMV